MPASPDVQHQERAQQIVAAYRSGQSMQQVANTFGVSRQAVSMMVARHAPQLAQEVVQSRRQQREHTKLQHQQSIEQRRAQLLQKARLQLPADRVLNVEDLTDALDCSIVDARWLLKQELPALVVFTVTPHPLHSDDDILAALRHAAATRPDRVLTADYYSSVRTLGQPSAHLIVLRMGWNNALTKAGLPTGKQRAPYRNRIGEEEALRWLRRFLQESPTSTRSAYETWSQQLPEAVSGATLCNRFGTWQKAVQAALDSATDY